MKTIYAYMAGILDGEGYLGLGKWKQKRYKHNYTYKTRIVISNCDLKLLEWLQDKFGGYITKKSKKPHWKQGYNLQIGNIQQWLPKVIPYLITKKDKAKLLLRASRLLEKRKKKTNTAGDLYLDELAKIKSCL